MKVMRAWGTRGTWATCISSPCVLQLHAFEVGKQPPTYFAPPSKLVIDAALKCRPAFAGSGASPSGENPTVTESLFLNPWLTVF